MADLTGFTLLILASALITCALPSATPPPLPILPVPTRAQLKWQSRELIMFFHFGVNTFTDSEWGTGKENPAIFNPTAFDAMQWVDVASNAGFSLVILTAKHHDGFCLWPSNYTDHSVAKSPWRGGKGDVVGELEAAATARGVDLGLYLSPWDRHERRYGQERPYNEFYMGQLQELLNRYGNISEIWFDGAKGSNAPNMTYYFGSWFSMVKELQSSINIFSDAGPDVRWVGNEKGFAGTTCWSTINRTSIHIGETNVSHLTMGDPEGPDWVPPECDVSIRKGWFWHKSEQAKPISTLLKIYYRSVGRNCVLLLNVPPNSSGLISPADVKALRQFRTTIDTIFATNLALSCSWITASSQRGGPNSAFGPNNVLDDDHIWTYWAPSESHYEEGHQWVELGWAGEGIKFNVVRIQEAVGLGQRIKRHVIHVDGASIVNATTVGYKRLHRLESPVNAHTLTIQILDSRGPPLISSVGLYFDPFPYVTDGPHNSSTV